MEQTVSELNAEHYKWGDDCDGWHLVKAPKLSIIKEKVPPGGKEKKHYHKHAHQFFYILYGEAVIEIDDEDFRVKEGEGIEVAPNMPHKFKNESNEDVVFIVTSSPSTSNDRHNLE